MFPNRFSSMMKVTIQLTSTLQAMKQWQLIIFLFNGFLRTAICLCVVNKAKARISKRVFPENKARQVFWKTNISNPLIPTRTCAYQGVRNVIFSKSLTSFLFLKHPFWDSPFAVSPTNSFLTLFRMGGEGKCKKAPHYFPSTLSDFKF